MKKLITLLAASLITTLSLANSIEKVAFANNLIGIYFTDKNLPQYHAFTLQKPDRLVIDFPKTSLKQALNTKPQGIVEHFNFSSNTTRTRLVFTFPSVFSYSSKHNAHHLQFIIHSKAAIKNSIHPQNTNKPAVPKKLEPAVVVIDPGHGGKDPGATGPKGIHEKNVVLAIGKDLRADLQKMAGINVDMTRTGDYFVTLRGRLRIARRDHADVFMAIHADSFPNKEARGATVFALSEHGATSEAARWLAHSENEAVLGGAKFSDQSKDVRSVLLDLSQSITIAHGLEFGNDVNNALKKVTRMHSGHVEQAPFVVLKSPDIPSLLVETGFISNVDEEAQLNSASFQHKMAAALAMGIREYLYQHPPRNSIIAAQKAGKLRYHVKQGDTVDSLANFFNVSPSALRKRNHLTLKQRLKIGQHIYIPS